jgi:hypothetical protein
MRALAMNRNLITIKNFVERAKHLRGWIAQVFLRARTQEKQGARLSCEQLEEKIVPSPVPTVTMEVGDSSITLGSAAYIGGSVSSSETMTAEDMTFAWGDGNETYNDYSFSGTSVPIDEYPPYYYSATGTYTITTTAAVDYEDDTPNSGSTTNTITVNQASVSSFGFTYGTGGLPTLVSGEMFYLSANIDGFSSPNITPSGTITYTATNEDTLATATIGTVTLSDSDSPGEASVPALTPSFAAGSYTLTANYSGDGNFYSDEISTDIIVGSPPPGTPPSNAPGTSTCSCSGPAMNTTGAPAATTTDANVVAADGAVKVVTENQSEEAFGTPYGETWTWTNEAGFSDGMSGSGGDQSQAPHLIDVNGSDSVAMVTNSSTAYFFDSVNGGYLARYGDSLSLSTTSVDGYSCYVVSDGDGDTFTFYGFGLSEPSGRAGELLSMTDANGDVTTVESWSGADPTEVLQTSGSGGSEVAVAFDST